MFCLLDFLSFSSMVRLWLCLCAPPFFFLLLLPFWWKCCPYINITSDDFSIRMLTSCAISSSPGEVFSIYIKDPTLQRLIKSLSLNIQSINQRSIWTWNQTEMNFKLSVVFLTAAFISSVATSDVRGNRDIYLLHLSSFMAV